MKHYTINDFIQTIEKNWSNEQIKNSCSKLIITLNNTPEEEAKFLTFKSISNFMKQNEINQVTINTINALTNAKIPVLEQHHLFIDDDDTEYPIENIEFKNAYNSNHFYHPHTGKLVKNWESKVIPYFTLSKFFLEAKKK
ncbi:MAG: hypothetical protein CMP22_05775 [Rickettsiales bacterium]|nr:hypothetical protein [Rickettsiales bacterium]|tara:strand:- start:105 stop:524 length:420 start_codon:yes stop_codon:yes gene_type:complete